MNVEWLIVGAGLTGSVLAERIASQLGQKVLVVEQRDHLAGNAFDRYDEHGVLVHQYGPHIFHTNNRQVWNYLSQFTAWRNYHHRVLGVIDGRLAPIPFNLNSLSALFPSYYADKLAGLLIEQYGFGVKVPILKLRENPSSDLKFLADYVYEKVFKHYTQKQWDLAPEELDPAVTERVPILISRDDRYFQDVYQGMPALGYAELTRRLLNHPKISVLLNTPYRDIASEIKPARLIFTGAIDEFFDYQYGELPYRSLNFKFYHQQSESIQSVATVNYPNEYDYTRITEFKHLTGQRCFGTTWIEEYPQAYRRGENDPYYPIPKAENQALYHRYQTQAEQQRGRIFFAGRLADYQYYNMDQAVARSLTLFEEQIKYAS